MFAIDGIKLPSKASKAKSGSPEGKSRYGRRFATVEPVFVNPRQ